MNRFLLLALFMTLLSARTTQGQDSSGRHEKWEFTGDFYSFFLPGEYIALPVFRADKGKLHLEARYNYEDLETFSGWVGYNFKGGSQLEYAITPMLGGVVGLSNGGALGLEGTLSFKKFEFYTETELFLDVKTADNHFVYTWSDLTYSPIDWLWFGLSGQRTRLYQTNLDIQKGIMGGTAWKSFEFTAYAYNVFFDDPFLLIGISASF